MIDPLISQSIRHSIVLTHYSNYVLAKMIRILNKTDSDLMAQLTAALDGLDADSFKVQRLDSLLASVRQVNADAYAAMRGELDTELRAYVEYEGQFQYDMYRSVVPVSFSIGTVVPEQVYAAAMAKPMQGRLLRQWASGLEDGRLQSIKDAISNGYTQGKTTAQIVSEIRGTKALNYADGLLDTSRQKVDSIVRTALSHTAQLTRSRFYKKNSDIIGELMWISTLDNRTSSECRARDHLLYTQEHAPVGHSLPWLSGPGRLHWGCRSTSVAMLKGQKRLIGTRSAAGGPVDANVSYNEWLAEQSADVQDDVLGKKRGDLYRKSGASMSGFVNDKGMMVSLKELAERDARAFGR